MKAETNSEYLTIQFKKLSDSVDEHQNIDDINRKWGFNFLSILRKSSVKLKRLFKGLVNMGFGAALEKCQLAQELKIIYDR